MYLFISVFHDMLVRGTVLNNLKIHNIKDAIFLKYTAERITIYINVIYIYCYNSATHDQ